MQTCSIKWNYSRHETGIFFTKVAHTQSITDIALLDFLLMLLSSMFISSYITIFFFFFCNWIYLFECLNISVNTIFKCICMFFGWERGHQLRMYATGGAIRGLSKCVQLYRGKGSHVFISFHVFGSIFVL